jgi:hypothetical protein
VKLGPVPGSDRPGVEMKLRVTRWSNQLNKLSDETADWSLTSRNPTVALQTGGHSASYG